ncbi:MAG: hypothetical protein HYX72_00565 [Acidobacteria bacterium]|nr:hypothetical protein [Acidobacteriota bacterium]
MGRSDSQCVSRCGRFSAALIDMRILLTGFEPFGAAKTNPSELIVRRIASESARRGYDLVAEVLPTEFRTAGKKIRNLIRLVKPDAVICLGVAATRDAICLERFALNVDDEASPDNAGHVRAGSAIVRDGPLAYQSTLPLKPLMKALQAEGVKAKISNHAGTYVCNHVFYVARHETERLGIPCGFIHVPAARGRTDGKGSKMTVHEMVAAVGCCLEVIAT